MREYKCGVAVSEDTCLVGFPPNAGIYMNIMMLY
jgi:hypothetical protein